MQTVELAGLWALVAIASGVAAFIWAFVVWQCYQWLLEEYIGDWRLESKREELEHSQGRVKYLSDLVDSLRDERIAAQTQVLRLTKELERITEERAKCYSTS